MTSDKETKRPPEKDGETARISPSAAKLMQILGTSPGYRNLTPYEIELLRESKQEMDQMSGEARARQRDASESRGAPPGESGLGIFNLSLSNGSVKEHQTSSRVHGTHRQESRLTSQEQSGEVLQKHGPDFERARRLQIVPFGRQAQADIGRLAHSSNADAVRIRAAAESRAGDCRNRAGSPCEKGGCVEKMRRAFRIFVSQPPTFDSPTINEAGPWRPRKERTCCVQNTTATSTLQ